MDFQNRKVLVIGSGISGVGVISLLKHFGADIIFYDSNEQLTEVDLRGKLKDVLDGAEDVSVEYITGAFPESRMDEVDVVVPSPGVPLDIPLVLSLKEKNIPIIGEIELGFLAEQGRVAAITGTNGKTTTTTLVGEIMKAHLGEEKVFVVGNIGNPYTMEVLATGKDTVTVGELSSFQLESVHSFKPQVSAILNITPDHLNRHHTMEAYAQAKEAITCNQDKENICVLNAENPYTAEFASRCPAQPVLFSSRRVLENGYYLKEDQILKSKNGVSEPLLDIHKDMNLVGICNVENVMAAIAIAEGMGVPMATILAVIKEFRAVEHRIEFVATKGGVDYYNDSKGTNPDAAIQGIKAMCKPTVLIGGGYDKGSEYDEWIDSFEDKVKYLVLIGQTKEKIAACAMAHGMAAEKIKYADTFETCLQMCTELAQEGDAVLLSPACASWGMFPNYEIRGQQFKEYVNAL